MHLGELQVQAKLLEEALLPCSQVVVLEVIPSVVGLLLGLEVVPFNQAVALLQHLEVDPSVKIPCQEVVLELSFLGEVVLCQPLIMGVVLVL